MSDNFNSSADDAQRRADKIDQIRSILHSVPDEPKPTEMSASAQASEWESELAARIASRVEKVKANKSSAAADILRELDLEAADAPTEKPQPFQENEEPEMEISIDALVSKINEDIEIPPYEPVQTVEEADEPKAGSEEAAEVSAVPDWMFPEENTQDEMPDFEIVRETAPPAEPEKEVKCEEVCEEEAVCEIAEEKAEISVPAAEIPEKQAKPAKKKKKRLRFLPNKDDSIGERIRKIIFIVSVIAIIICGYLVLDYYMDLWKSKKINDEVMDLYWTYEDEQPTTEVEGEGDEAKKKYFLLSGARKLLDINPDVVGVIKIDGTPIDNPVMQAEDNEKYLDRKITGEKSRNGELFLDYRNNFDDVDEEGYLRHENSDNLLIYGHNMGDETMFGCLKYYQRKENYYGEHPVIELNSNYMKYKYKIFAVFILDAEDETETKFDCWNKLNFNDEEEFYDFVNEAKRRTIRLNDVDVKYGDKLVTLSTCNTYLGDRGRLIIMGRLVRDGEDPLEGTQSSRANPNIKWPTMYYNTKKNEHYDPDAEFVPYGPAAEENN